jgi:hypothetical protein
MFPRKRAEPVGTLREGNFSITEPIIHAIMPSTPMHSYLLIRINDNNEVNFPLYQSINNTIFDK